MIKNIPISFTNTGFSDVDQEQLSLLFENASRKLLDILSQRLGTDAAANFRIYVTNTTAAALEEKVPTINLASGNQIITPTSGKDGMSKVTITKPETLVASNIKKDVVIFGVTGTYEA